MNSKKKIHCKVKKLLWRKIYGQSILQKMMQDQQPTILMRMMLKIL